MNNRIGRTELERMFAEAAREIREKHEVLSQLDCVGGDGDHGTTMLRAVEKLEAAVHATSAKGLSILLKGAGWGVLGVDGGASSALLGTLIAGMGDVELGEECDCQDWAASLEAGLHALSKQTKAKPGDKTMMDALIPGVRAFEAAAVAGSTIVEAMEVAAAAAQAGADATRDMVARYGRAKFLGEKTRGYADAGATSVALLFRGFSTALAQKEKA